MRQGDRIHGDNRQRERRGAAGKRRYRQFQYGSGKREAPLTGFRPLVYSSAPPSPAYACLQSSLLGTLLIDLMLAILVLGRSPAGQPISVVGLRKRVMIYGYLLWVALLTLVLPRAEKKPGPASASEG